MATMIIFFINVKNTQCRLYTPFSIAAISYYMTVVVCILTQLLAIHTHLEGDCIGQLDQLLHLAEIISAHDN